MKRKQVIKYILLALIIVTSFVGCSQEGESYQAGDEEKGVTLYYLNPEGTKLLEYWFEYEEIQKDTEEAVEVIIEQLKQSPDLSKYKAVITENMGFHKVKVEDSYVSLDFNTGYGKLDMATEVLCRGAIVKSITQLSKVNNVEITMNGQPITDRDGKVIGIMNSESFIMDANDLSSYGTYGEVNIYFADTKGEKLVKYQTQLDTGNNVSMEQKVIGSLIKGPDSERYKATIPEGTKVIKTSVKDGICYVDLNRKFLEGVADVSDEVTIYSIVNSLVELPNINKVQFTIEGERVAKYRETIAFDGIFERNLELIKGE